MKLDTLNYQKLPDGTIKKIVVHEEDLLDSVEEIRVLNKQLKDIVAGVTETPEYELIKNEAIDNYTAQIATLSEGIDSKVLEEALNIKVDII